MSLREKAIQEYIPIYTDDSPSRSSGSSFEDIDLQRLRRTSTWQSARAWVLHCVLIAAYTTIFMLSMTRARKTNSVFGLLDSPAKLAGTETHLEVFDIMGPPHGIYTGEPRPELDKAWRDLLQYNNIRISDEWIHRWERENEAVKLPDGGYLGMLSVMHELHCIKRIYQTLNPEYYFPNATEEEISVNREHNKHCLEVLRMGATCRADVSIITHMWTDIDSQPIVNQTAPHQCVDFSKVIDYSRDNTVDVFQENYIVHPKFGPSFVHGHSIKPFNDMHDHA
ncbi:hypothetical protein B0O99DRAFT_550499 [Bisporella sp. PMI_857]|nr:hypothetical protein B0O99DRAFT_550499 [Bisporella sp. PMI_857]